MNRRQKTKRLKRDNDLMRRVINATPEMKFLYDAYTATPKIVTTMRIERLAGYHNLPLEENVDGRVMEAYKEWLAEEIFKLVRGYIHFKINRDGYMPRLEASLYVGVGQTKSEEKA